MNFKADEICQVGQPLLEMEVDDSIKVKDEIKKQGEKKEEHVEKPEKKVEPVKAPESPPQIQVSPENIYTTPAVRNLALQLKIDLSRVQGTGKKGRITKEDVLNYQEPAKKEPQSVTKEPVKAEPKKKREDKVVKLTGIRKAMAKSMTDAVAIPHYNTIDFISIETLKKARKTYLDANPKKKLTMMPFLIKACATALQNYPVLNSLVDPTKLVDGAATEYVQKAEVNMSLAIDTPSGLLVPNLKSVQRKSVLEINEEFQQLVEKGRKGALTQTDLSDGTFTLSNIGNIGCITGTPVVFRPQVAIAAVGTILTVPNYTTVKGETKVNPIDVVGVSLTCDHRIINGATAVKYLRTVKEYLENLESLLIILK